jgi:hypothetical protein
MTRQINFTTLYFLLEAFDRLGARLYDDEWTGLEAWACPKDPPDDMLNRRKVFTDQMKALDARVASLQQDFNYAADREEQSRISAEKRPLEVERAKLDMALRSLPNLSDSYHADHAMFVRRERTEQTLWKAAGESKFQFQYGIGPLIDWRTWRTKPGFNVYLNLSMATTSDRMTGQRRMPVLVDRVAFDQWLGEITPMNAPPDSREAQEATFVAYLKSETLKNPNRLRKTDFQEIAKATYKIGTGRFRTLWDSHASKKQQRPGRPRKPD